MKSPDILSLSVLCSVEGKGSRFGALMESIYFILFVYIIRHLVHLFLLLLLFTLFSIFSFSFSFFSFLNVFFYSLYFFKRIACARSIGDADYKDFFLPPEEQALCCIPDIYTLKITEVCFNYNSFHSSYFFHSQLFLIFTTIRLSNHIFF